MNDSKLLLRTEDVSAWSGREKTSLLGVIVGKARADGSSSERRSYELKRQLNHSSTKEKFELRKLFAKLSNNHRSPVTWLLVGVGDDGSLVGYVPTSKEYDSIQRILGSSELIYPAPVMNYDVGVVEGVEIGIYQIIPSPVVVRVRGSLREPWVAVTRDGTVERKLDLNDLIDMFHGERSRVPPEYHEHTARLGYYSPSRKRVGYWVRVDYPKEVLAALSGELSVPPPRVLPIPLNSPRHAFGIKLYRACSRPLICNRRILPGLVGSLFSALESQGITYDCWTLATKEPGAEGWRYWTGAGPEGIRRSVQASKLGRLAWYLNANGVQNVLTAEIQDGGLTLTHFAHFPSIPTGRKVPLIQDDGRVRLQYPDLMEFDLGDSLEGVRHNWKAKVNYTTEGPVLTSKPVGRARVVGYLGKKPRRPEPDSWPLGPMTVFEIEFEKDSPGLSESKAVTFLSSLTIGRLRSRNRIVYDASRPFDIAGLEVQTVVFPASFFHEVNVVFCDIALDLHQDGSPAP